MSNDKGKRGNSFHEYHYGNGDIQRMEERYGVEGQRSAHPDGRSGKPPRRIEEVHEDIGKAMMNDYDTRRTMEAAAMAGDEEARKFAEEGFTGDNIYASWDKMKSLKKEHIGGGGMLGAKNRAGLTQAMVDWDRDEFNKSIDERIAAAQSDASDSVENTTEDDSPSNRLEQARLLANVFKQDVVNNYIDDYGPNATSESIDALRDGVAGSYNRDLTLASQVGSESAAKASSFADFYKTNVKGSLNPS